MVRKGGIENYQISYIVCWKCSTVELFNLYFFLYISYFIFKLFNN